MKVMGLKALGLILIVPALTVQGLVDCECCTVSYKVELGTVRENDQPAAMRAIHESQKVTEG